MRSRPGALLAVAAALVACPPTPDPDALPEGAIALRFGRTYMDQLECKRNDCTDWFRILVPAKGDVSIELRPAETAPEALAVSGTLIEKSGRQVARANALTTPTGRPELRIDAPVTGGTHFLAVSAPGTSQRIEYRLLVTFKAAPPPPPRPPSGPVFRKLTSAVLEVEGKRSVLLEKGVRDGLRPGQSGRLIENGRVIGEITVTEVYNDGSRARIEPGLSGTITSRTQAEISVPK